jgi:hypothetical protein
VYVIALNVVLRFAYGDPIKPVNLTRANLHVVWTARRKNKKYRAYAGTPVLSYAAGWNSDLPQGPVSTFINRVILEVTVTRHRVVQYCINRALSLRC